MSLCNKASKKCIELPIKYLHQTFINQMDQILGQGHVVIGLMEKKVKRKNKNEIGKSIS